MPRLDSDVKLDFKDVLVRPKRSTLKSRSEVGGGNKSSADIIAIHYTWPYTRILVNKSR